VQLQIDRASELGHRTSVVDGLKAIVDGHRQMISRAAEMGVALVAGSDAGSCGVPHGAGLLDELCHMQAAGLPPLAVLRAATGTSARTLEFAEPIGLIRAGHRSRLIFTRHAVAASVANLRHSKAVLFDGRFVDGSDCADATLATILAQLGGM
jgi:imidazolonepropionase-like amidohydrolase